MHILDSRAITHLGCTEVLAQRTHECVVCGKPIKKGEVYLVQKSIGEGQKIIRERLHKNNDRCN